MNSVQRRCFALLAALVLVGANPAAPTSYSAGSGKPLPPDKGSLRYGGIEIGAKGVKAVSLDISPLPREVRLLGRPGEKKMTVNTTLIDTELRGGKVFIKADAIDETAEAVEELFLWLRDRQGVPAENISVVASSGVPRAANLNALLGAVKTRTNREVRLLSLTDETSLMIWGVIDARLRGDAIVVDLGTGTIKVGYYEPPTKTSLGWLSIIRNDRLPGVGVYHQLVCKAVEARRACGLTASFQREAEALRSPRITAPLQAEIMRRPLLVNHQRAYFAGGTVWAMIALVKPEAASQEQVRFTVADIEAFRKLVCASPEAFPAVDLSRLNIAQRTAAEAELAKVKRVFAPEQLVSGAEILAGVAEAFRLKDRVGGKSRELIFVRDGQYGWIMAYVRMRAR